MLFRLYSVKIKAVKRSTSISLQAPPNDARAYQALGNDYLELAKQYLVAANQATKNPILNKQVALVVAAQSAELVMTTPSFQGSDEATVMQVAKEVEYSEEQIRQQIVSTLRA
ncbi:MAG: hypothetical protein ACI810_002494 [Gammaproteobacteria bacterium]